MTYTPNECYVEVWREADFRGESRRIYGPAEHTDMRFKDGDWANDIGSLRVGPHAFVMAYRGEKFQDAMHAFGPNDQVSDLAEMKFGDEIDSIRLISSMKIFERLYESSDEQRRTDVKGTGNVKAEGRRRKGQGGRP